jgi:hypothetical protein
MVLHRSVLLGAGWLALVAVFFRWWDLTTRAGALTLWTLIFAAAFAATVLLSAGVAALRRGPERARLLLWLVLAAVAGAGSIAFPAVRIRDATVHTRVFVAVLDTVVPLWVLVRAIMVLWSGRVRVAAVVSLPALLLAGLWFFVIAMPGRSAPAALPALTAAESSLAVQLETLGFYSDEAGSQRYPPPLRFFYPDRGNFVGFVGNMDSRAMVHRAIGAFRRVATLPSEGAAAPALLPGISWSDHQEFWRFGWKALMITDTAPFRNVHYHQPSDTADRLDYGRMARLIGGLVAVLEELAGPGAGNRGS